MATPADAARLPLRDLFLIPLIALLTVIVLGGSAEIVAGFFFGEAQYGSCGVPDALLPYRYAANCSYRNKAAEGPLVEYRFNACGYRNAESCGPRAPGTVRVAVLGASTAEGFKVAYPDSWAARATSQLTRQCHRTVEFQNLGIPGLKVIDQYFRVDEALRLKPDLAMLVVTPYELVDPVDPQLMANRDHPERVLRKPAVPGANEKGLLSHVSAMLSDSKAALAAQVILFQNRDQYIKLFLMHGDKADYLRTPFSAAWEKRLADLDILLGGMADRLDKAGLPFVVVYTPQRIQAALADPVSRPRGVDPDALGKRLATIAAKHGIVFIDAFDAFRHLSGPENLFYPVDGHMRPGGHALVADAVTSALVKSALPGFGGCAPASSATP